MSINFNTFSAKFDFSESAEQFNKPNQNRNASKKSMNDGLENA